MRAVDGDGKPAGLQVERPSIGGLVATASPGAGVVQSASSGAIFHSEITGNASAGLSDQSTGETAVQDVFFFDNNPNFRRWEIAGGGRRVTTRLTSRRNFDT